MPTSQIAALIVTTFVAAAVNGAVGYGFSSITVPVALLFITNRVLNPAVVVIEVAINLAILVMARGEAREAWVRVRLMVLGLVPAIVLGGLGLRVLNPNWLKLATYVVLLPLVGLQLAGLARSFRLGWRGKLASGFGLGTLYALTTISGPPLALVLNSEGIPKRAFKAAMGLVRTLESVATAGTYAALGLVGSEGLSLDGWIAPGVLLGLVLGHLASRRISQNLFRGICMAFDLAIIGFGLSRVAVRLSLASPAMGDAIAAMGLILGVVLLYRFVRSQLSAAESMGR